MTATYITPRQAVRTMMRVIYALILRETHNRYGQLKIGYLWAILEPMFFVVVLTLAFSYIRQRNSGDMPPVLFYVTGILPFFMFRNVLTRTMMAIKQNSQLLTFPQIQNIDLVVARSILELANFFIVICLFVFVIDLINLEDVKIDNYLVLLQAVLLLYLMGFGIGVAVSALIPLFPSAEIITNVILRPLLFLSGIFYTVEVLPEEARNIALYNPVLHLIELFRSGFFLEFESQYVNMEYVTSITLIALFFGLLLQRALRRYTLRTS